MDNYIVITTSGLINIYDDRIDFQDDPSKFLYSFPITAIESVNVNLDNINLHLENVTTSEDGDSQNINNFIDNKFSLKIKHDFLHLFLHNEYENAI